MVMSLVVPFLVLLSVLRGSQWLAAPYGDDNHLDIGRCLEFVFELFLAVTIGMCLCCESFLYAKGQWRLLVAHAHATNC